MKIILEIDDIGSPVRGETRLARVVIDLTAIAFSRGRSTTVERRGRDALNEHVWLPGPRAPEAISYFLALCLVLSPLSVLSESTEHRHVRITRTQVKPNMTAAWDANFKTLWGGTGCDADD